MHPILGDAYWFWQHPAVTILGLLLVGGVAGIAPTWSASNGKTGTVALSCQ